ncbi:MAG: hypothetical protein IJD01_07860 [Clostridia bacterium]|nr:hypothetical protein [Clostridia bacterium]
MSKKLKIQWIVNVALLVFTLLTLVVAVVAWFADSRTADVESIQLSVARKDLKLVNEVTTVEFPYSTKIADTTVAQAFNNGAAVAKEYIIENEGMVSVSVDCFDSGMLAYICDESTDEISYDVIFQALQGQLGGDTTQWTYDRMRDALNTINSARVYGTMTGDGNTHVKIVYWVEYEEVKEKLETDDYVNLANGNGFKALVTFVDEA